MRWSRGLSRPEVVAAEEWTPGRRAPGTASLGINAPLAGRFLMCANESRKGMI
jgi:hypothetical protein